MCKNIFISLVLTLIIILPLSSCTSKDEHRFGAWEVVDLPDYNTKGKLSRVCLDEGCTEKETQELKASSRLTYEQTDTGIFVSSIGQCKDELLYISSKTPDGKTVTGISPSAFLDLYDITDVVIEDGIAEIGDAAFAGCSNLKTATLPNSVKILDVSAFSKCSSLTDIILSEALTEISPNCFDECTALSHIFLPNSITSIGYSAFNLCTILEDINFPDSLKSIGTYAFADCTKLSRVVFPDSLELIDTYAFSNCTSLEEIVLPSALHDLGSCAFFKCGKLKSVFIPVQTQCIHAPDGLSPFYQSNVDLIISTNAQKQGDGWEENFNAYFIPDSVNKDSDAVYLTVNYNVNR